MHQPVITKSPGALALAVVACQIVLGPGTATTSTQPKVPSLRLYVLDCGRAAITNLADFGFSSEQVTAKEWAFAAYLITHPRGTVLFDAGVLTDAAIARSPGGGIADAKPLKARLNEIGYRPADIDYLVLSHLHSDHDANAGDFAGATWVVQRAERDTMFSGKQVFAMSPEHYAALKNAKTTVLDNRDLDIFGDGSVVVMATPGHTPGHQAVALTLPTTGHVMLAGDLYHLEEERFTDKVPTFEFDKSQSLASRARIEDYVKKNDAQLWIEHDLRNLSRLRKAPSYYE